ncbi:hypothetical protein [Sphingomonas sp. LY160]|uniref:hypothetical protein n=1 Tax=Sphingomonas sp. LY160 TaxID=3095342 RepID=UPI002ADEE95E|nr:hypothetical protein [Sphingomonas sp. LY160]MEA1071249.1 hypothetical protein [Sphingomonas sp. LY160]
MATTKTTKTRSAPKKKASDNIAARAGRTVRDRPYASAAIATGAVTAVAAAAAGAFFFSRRDKSINETAEELSAKIKGGLSDAGDKLREVKDRFTATDKDQSDFAAEALSLKETGKKTSIPADPVVEDQLKAGAIAY